MPNLVVVENNYPDAAALRRLLNYVMRSGMVGGYAVDPACAFQQMAAIKEAFHQQEGKQLFHFLITLLHSEAYRVSVEELLQLGFQVGRLFKEYQLVYAVHLDASHVHLHFVMNTVSFEDGHKYSDGLGGFWQLRAMLWQRFPKSEVGLYRSFSRSDCNRFSFSAEDDLLEIG